MIHLYVGDGKGKTTAAVGLALRALGQGKSVLFCQFLKAGSSGELEPLRGAGAKVLCTGPDRFIFRMPLEELEAARAAVAAKFGEIRASISGGGYDLVVLDEAVDAVNARFIEKDALLDLIRACGAQTELVLTGRDPAPELAALADYHTEFICRAHPYQKGIAARRGVEY